MPSATHPLSPPARYSRCWALSSSCACWIANQCPRASSWCGARLTRQLNSKRRAFVRLALSEHAAAEPLDRLAHQREADTGAGILVVPMQPLEQFEDVVVIL